MRQIMVQGFITTENEAGVVLQFADMTTGTTILLDVSEAEALVTTLPKAIAEAWDLVKAQAAGETTPAVDTACPILPPNADEGKCVCQLTPQELDAILQEKGNGLGQPPAADPRVKEDGFDSEDARSC